MPGIQSKPNTHGLCDCADKLQHIYNSYFYSSEPFPDGGHRPRSNYNIESVTQGCSHWVNAMSIRREGDSLRLMTDAWKYLWECAKDFLSKQERESI